MKWGLSCRASKMLSNGPTLRSLSFFYTEFGTILCCSVAVFGRGTATLHRYVFKKFVFPPQSSYGPQLFLWSKYTTRVSCLRCISIMTHMCSELQPLRGWVVGQKKWFLKISLPEQQIFENEQKIQNLHKIWGRTDFFKIFYLTVWRNSEGGHKRAPLRI